SCVGTTRSSTQRLRRRTSCTSTVRPTARSTARASLPSERVPQSRRRRRRTDTPPEQVATVDETDVGIGDGGSDLLDVPLPERVRLVGEEDEVGPALGDLLERHLRIALVRVGED